MVKCQQSSNVTCLAHSSLPGFISAIRSAGQNSSGTATGRRQQPSDSHVLMQQELISSLDCVPEIKQNCESLLKNRQRWGAPPRLMYLCRFVLGTIARLCICRLALSSTKCLTAGLPRTVQGNNMGQGPQKQRAASRASSRKNGVRKVRFCRTV